MKVALCISGLMRTAEIACPSIVHNLIEPLQCDVFVSTWNIIGTGKHNLEATELFRQQLPENLVPRMFGKALKNYIIYDYEQIKPKLTQYFYQGLNAMFWQVQQANFLRQAYEKENNFSYDLVVRARPDVSILEPIMFPEVTKNDIANLIFLANVNNEYKTVCDYFALSSAENMDIYSNFYDHISVYADMAEVGAIRPVAGVSGIMPEQILREYLVAQGLQLVNYPVNLRVERGEFPDLYL